MADAFIMKMEQVFGLYNLREEKKLVFSLAYNRILSVSSASVPLTEFLGSERLLCNSPY
jgi:hypothetical protein